MNTVKKSANGRLLASMEYIPSGLALENMYRQSITVYTLLQLLLERRDTIQKIDLFLWSYIVAV
jgi:hypothetical protein